MPPTPFLGCLNGEDRVIVVRERSHESNCSVSVPKGEHRWLAAQLNLMISALTALAMVLFRRSVTIGEPNSSRNAFGFAFVERIFRVTLYLRVKALFMVLGRGFLPSIWLRYFLRFGASEGSLGVW